MFTRRLVSEALAADSGNVKRNRFKAGLAAGALFVCALIPSMAWGQSGWVRKYTETGTPCSGSYCQFWEDFDRNGFTARIAAAGGTLYQLHGNGAIYKAPTLSCTNFCPGWAFLGYNPATKAIYAGGNSLYQLRTDGSIWRFKSGTEWEMLDNNPATLTLAAGGDKLYQLHNTGEVFLFKGSPCTGTYCPSWEMLYPDSRTGGTVAIAASTSGELYRLLNDGSIWRYGLFTCLDLGVCWTDWERLDNNSSTVAIAAGGAGKLYQLRSNGSILRYKTVACDCSGWTCPESCPGWELLDNNPATKRIVATADKLYQLHQQGALFRYTNIPCDSNGCPGWELLMHDGVGWVAADGDHVYELNQPVVPSARQRGCDECR